MVENLNAEGPNADTDGDITNGHATNGNAKSKTNGHGSATEFPDGDQEFDEATRIIASIDAPSTYNTLGKLTSEQFIV